MGTVGQWLFGPPSSSQGSRFLWVPAGLTLLFSLLMLPYAFSVVDGLDETRSDWALGVGCAYIVSYLMFVILGEMKAWFVRMLMCVLLLGLGTALVALAGLENSWVLVFALCVIGAFSRPVVSGGAVVLVAAALAIAALVSGRLDDVLTELILLTSVGSAMILFMRLVDTNAELRKARDEVAEFAVVKERERVARDLHDILGHSITSITVQAGVLRRLLEHAGHTQEATQAGEIERVARLSLAEVRATASDYRSVTLASEIAEVSALLRSAGIDATLPQAVDHVSDEAQRVLGYVVREAVTNAVRHSGATKVEVRLGSDRVEVMDDGPGTGTVAKGNGLRGLEERIKNHGGNLRFGRRPEGGFHLVADLSSGDEGDGDGAGHSAEDRGNG